MSRVVNDHQTIQRRKTVLKRLESQLKDGRKTIKKSTRTTELLDVDKRRIEKEISILKTRI